MEQPIGTIEGVRWNSLWELLRELGRTVRGTLDGVKLEQPWGTIETVRLNSHRDLLREADGTT